MHSDRLVPDPDDFNIGPLWERPDGGPADSAPMRAVSLLVPESSPDAQGDSQLGELQAAIEGLRADVATVLEREPQASRPTRAPRSTTESSVAELVNEVSALVGQIATLSDEIVSLRRRIALRAGGAPDLGPDEVARIADAVAAHLIGDSRSAKRLRAGARSAKRR